MRYKTPSRTSPLGGKRACLCRGSNTYSIKCCDGSLWAQGVGISIDSTPPEGYTIEWNQSVIDFQNYLSASFHIGNGQAQAYCYYTITDINDQILIGSVNMEGDTELDVPVDISALADGTLTLAAYLADPNQGETITKTIEKIVETSQYVYTLQARMDSFENETCVYASLNELVAIDIV